MRTPAVSPVTAFVGGGVTGWMCLGGVGVGFSAVFDGLGDLLWNCDFVRSWRRLGSLFSYDGCGAWGLGGEDAGVEGTLRWAVRGSEETMVA